MSSTQRILSVLFVLTLVSVSLPGAESPDKAAKRSSGNVLVTITLGQVDGGKKVPANTYQLVAEHRGRARLVTGERIPIPVTKFQTSTPPDGDVVPITSYSYQNVGFTAEVEVVDLGDGTISLKAELESSRVRAGSAKQTGQPTIETHQQSIKATLTDGVPLQVSQVDNSGGSVYFEIKAEILG